MRSTVPLLAIVFLGCGGRGLDDEFSFGPLDGGNATPDAALPDGAKPPTPVDASGPLPTDAGPGPGPGESLAECFGDMGASSPSSLKDLMYDHDATCSDGSECYLVLRFNVGCGIELEHSGGGRFRATASKDDCAVLVRWATSERLLSALSPSSPEGKECMATADYSRRESTFVGGTGAALKTFYCPVEPFITNRRCLQRVVAKYFPGI